MTEAEAKMKWCPMVRFHIGANQRAYDNKPGDKESANKDSAFCIGSACMMWRWKTKLEETAGWQLVRLRLPDGYCGLAGKP